MALLKPFKIEPNLRILIVQKCCPDTYDIPYPISLSPIANQLAVAIMWHINSSGQSTIVNFATERKFPAVISTK